MRHALCNRADLLLALVNSSDEAADFIARNLGLEFKIERPTSHVDKTQTITTSSLLSVEITQLPLPTYKQLPDVPFWRVEVNSFLEMDEEAAKYKQTSGISLWQLSSEKIYPPLTSWRHTLPRFRRHLLRPHFTGRIDIDKILVCLSRAESIQTLPRKSRRGWGSELQLIVDCSAMMAPYGSDQMSVMAEFARLFSRQAISYAEYRQGDEQPVIIEPQGAVYDYRFPQPGTLVIALTDLGLFNSKTEQAVWRQLGQQLQQNQCHALALIPTSINSIDTVLQRYWRIIPWEQSRALVDQDQAKQVDRLLVLISPATRIEPGFLRQVRQLIDADVSIETELWQHPALISRSSVAAALDPKIANELRARFKEEDKTIRTEVLKLLRSWRTHLPKEIWYEEIISLDEASQALLPWLEEVQQAYDNFSSFGQRLVDGEQVGGLSRWFRGMEQRLPQGTWKKAEIKPALHRMWHSTHHDEPDAVPPDGYDPKNIPVSQNNPTRTFQLYQKGATLQLLEANPPVGLATESNRGSWLGQIKSRNGEIAIVPKEPKPFWQSDQPPTWASDWGEDEYGRWVEFRLEQVIQRLRWIPSGSFMMGSPESEEDHYEDEGPQHQVTLAQGYWLFDTAVSQALWQAVMGDNPSSFQEEDKPVDQVSWDDCQVFLEKLNALIPGLSLSLPSEAQWEYACRAGSQTPYSFGQQITHEQANYFGRDENETVSVKAFQANAWGFYQMHGNVDEWCLDGMRDYTDDDPLGSMEAGTSRVVRGGSWGNGARFLRAASRVAFDPEVRDSNLGLRCARVQRSRSIRGSIGAGRGGLPRIVPVEQGGWC